MLDMKAMRTQPDHYKKLLESRGVSGDQVDHLLSLDQKRRDLIQRSESLKKERNEVTKQISEKKSKNEDAQEAIDDMKKVGQDIKTVDSDLAQVEDQIFDLASGIPNIPHESVPVGPGEEDNVEVRRWGDDLIPQFEGEPKAHWDIGTDLGILDFERASKVASSRFVYYRKLGARLERALYNFMLDKHVDQEGYEEVIPPYLANDQTMYGTGQFPKFKEDVYQVDGHPLTLIPTSEVPLTNFYQDEILEEEDLPQYLTALTPSYRSEAGSAGRDTRGIIRLHQFNKVEMVKLSKPEDSFDELEKMVANAEGILQDLKLPYRVITLSTGDMGFSATKTYDLEVWIPAQNTYREISSCSNCGDFQARRAKIRYRHDEGQIDYVHTLNGSGLAVGRTVAAILENYQQPDGSVKVPDVLVPYMNNIKYIK